MTTTGDEEDTATAVLWELGTSGIEVQDAGPGQVALLAYFAGLAPEQEVAAALPSARVEAVAVPEVDWVARLRDSFRPFRAGGFHIAPAWDPPEPGPRVLLVEPGRAFGTGSHESTRLCLAALEALASRRPLGRVLDVGTGTGLLAVAAARLGARTVTAVDTDPEAVESARLHAGLNGTALLLLRGDGGRALRPATFDVVVANLTPALLLERQEELTGLLAPHGRLVLSGLLATDRAAVEEAYRPSFSLEVREDGEWAALVGSR